MGRMPTPQHLSEMPYEAEVMVDWLTGGKPELGWRGDPRLSLHVAVISAGKSGYSSKVGRYVTAGQALAYRYEVWRHLEDGTDERIITCGMDELHTLLPKLCKMDPRSPGFEDTFEAAVKANDAEHKRRGDAIKEAHGEMTEHLFKLWHDRNNPKTTFRGLPGQNPDKQD